MTAANVYPRLLKFIGDLDKINIHYRLSSVRPEAVMIEVAVPGERWEVEFLEDGSVDVEKFLSDGHIFGETELAVLFSSFSD